MKSIAYKDDKIKLLAVRVEKNIAREFEEITDRKLINKSALLRKWIADYVNEEKEKVA
jgi:metal-responsive CopG/Arc/MetJ family transcriptional regulator